MPQSASHPAAAHRFGTLPSPDSVEIDVGGDCSYSIQAVSQLHQLESIVDEWSSLTRQAADPNVFYAPWSFLPAMKHLSPPVNLQILLVWRKKSPNTNERRLCGFFPVVEQRRFGGLRVWSLWSHPYCFLTNPLIEQGQEAGVFQAVLNYLRQEFPKISGLEFPLLAGEGRLHRGLTEVIRENLLTTFHFDKYLRATTPYVEDSEELIKSNVNGHHLRELRRLRRKMESQGQLEYRWLQDPQSQRIWLDQFLALEASGWKAEAGTAMLQESKDSDFFREMIAGGVTLDQVRMEGLFLNGEPIAMKVNLLSPPVAFAFKIAFDETLRKSSPGFQLELESLIQFGLQRDITWADSCAAPGHPMINRVWKDRRVIQHLLISTGHGFGDLLIGAMPLVRSLRRHLKHGLRAIRGK